MTDPRQFKSYTTRKFPAELHHRMRVVAATQGITMEDAFNMVVAAGLEAVERAIGMGEEGKP